MKEKDAEIIVGMVSDIPQDSTLDDVLQELLAVFGGPQGYAREVHANYQDEKATPHVRQKALDLIGTLMSRKASIEKGVEKDFSKFPTEDLRIMLEHELKDFGDAFTPSADS